MSDMTTLRTKAESGDSKAMLDLGFAYLDKGDLKSALPWWEKSADAGNKDATHNLIMTYANPHSGVTDGALFLKWLKKLAVEQGDGWGKILLGTVYCGTNRGHSVWIHTFKTDEFASHKNPDEGIRLIEEGLTLGENDLNHHDYSAIAYAYYWRNGEGAENRDMNDLNKAICYQEKALARAPAKYVTLTHQSIEAFKRELESIQEST